MYNLETKLQKQFSKDHDKNFIVPNNCVVICPWIIRNGFQNVAENGYLSKNADPRYYGFFQKIFTGNESITATWEGSTYLTKIEDEYKFKYNFQVGKYYFGVPVIGSATGGISIENVESNEDYLGMKEEGTVTIRVEGWVPTRQDKYKLYTIPDLYGAQWFYISEVKYLNDLQWTEGVDSTNIPVVEVTFTTLVDKLQNSGKAVEQYVQYAAPGEPYCVPLVFNRDLNQPQPNPNEQPNEAWIEPYKEVSFMEYQAISTNYLQIELQGANAISGVQIVGRTLTRNEQGEYISSPWKFLLPYRMIANQVNEINRTSLPSRNFYWFPQGSLDFVTSNTFQQAIKERDDALATNQAAGKLEMGATSDWSNIGTGLHRSNPLVDDLHFDYNNTAWLPQSYFSSVIDHDTTGCYYSVDNLQYDGTETMIDLLTKNGFIFSTQPILPLGFKSSKPYHVSTIPIIGSIISKFYGDYSINPNTTQRKPLTFGYFVDCDVAGMLVNIFNNQSGQAYCPIDAIVGDETKASKYLGTTALNTTLAFELTDQVLDTTFPDGGKNLDTICFGQTKDENGEFILPTQLPYLYGSAGQKPTKKDENSILVIDEVTVYALHKGKIKVSGYYNPDTPTWTTTINSKANWTDSIRDWATTISTGGWGIDWCDWTAADWPWPERPGKISNPYVPINYSPKYSSSESDLFKAMFDYEWRNNFNNYIWDSGAKQVYLNQNIPSFTQTWNYEDLNVSGVVDKTSFKNYFKSVKFPFNTKLWTKTNQKTYDLQSNKGFEIELDSRDTYSIKFGLCSFGEKMKSDVPPPLEIIDNENLRQAFSFDFNLGSLPSQNSQGNLLSWCDYELILNENNFTINITYNVNAIGKRWDTLPEWRQHISFDVYSRGEYQTPESYLRQFSYSYDQQIAEFVPKGLPPTGYYLAGGSEVLGGYRYSSGQDDKIWYLYNADGEVVTPDTMGISYVTVPPGIGNATYERVGDGLRVKWTSSQTPLDFYIYVNATVGTEQIKKKVHIIIV